MKKFTTPIDKFQAILFDFDGVLAESMNVKTEAFEQLFKPYGDEVTKKVIKHHIENGGISRYKKIKYYYSHFLNKEISDYKLEEIAKKFSDIVVNKVIVSEWVGGVKDFLEKYYNKIDLYIVSGTPQKEMELIIKKRNMEKYFKGIYGSPDTKPVITKRIIKQNKYNKKNVIYIGDCLSDYNDSIEADIPFLGRVTDKENPIFPEEVDIISDFFEILK